MNEELRQQLWDLIYGLLEPDEAAALKARISSEPAVARLYAEIRLQQDLVADAAKIEVAPITLVPQTKVAPAAKTPAAATKRGTPEKSSRPSPSRNWASVVVALAAVALIGIFSAGLWMQAQPGISPVAMNPNVYFREAPQATTPADERSQLNAPRPEQADVVKEIVTEVRGPETVVAGMTNHFLVKAKTADNQPVAAKWNVRLQDETGTDRFSVVAESNADGEADVAIPGEALRESGRLVVDRLALGDTNNLSMASNGAAAGELDVAVEVAPETFFAHLEVDRPIARPGETVGFRTVVLGEQSHAISAAVPAEFELFDAEGNSVPGTHVTDTTHYGVAAADAIIPSNLADGVYELAVRSPNGDFEEQRTRLVVQSEGALAMLDMDEANRNKLNVALQDNARGLRDSAERQRVAGVADSRLAMTVQQQKRAEADRESEVAELAKKSDNLNALSADALRNQSVQGGAGAASRLKPGADGGAKPEPYFREAGGSPSSPPPAPAPALAPPGPAPAEVAPSAPVKGQAEATPTKPLPTAPRPDQQLHDIAPKNAPAPSAMAGRSTEAKGGYGYGGDVDGSTDKAFGAHYAAPGAARGGMGGGQGGLGNAKQEAEQKYFSRFEGEVPTRRGLNRLHEGLAGKDGADKNRLPSASDDLRVIADEGDGVVLELTGPAAEAKMVVISGESGLPLVEANVVENDRDQREQETLKRENVNEKSGVTLQTSARRIKLRLPPEASGPLQIAAIADDPVKILSATEWTRPAHRFANVAIDAKAKKFAVGDEVELELSSQTEAGQPLPAVLGVRIVNAELEKWAEQPPAGTMFGFGGGVGNPVLRNRELDELATVEAVPADASAAVLRANVNGANGTAPGAALKEVQEAPKAGASRKQQDKKSSVAGEIAAYDSPAPSTSAAANGGEKLQTEKRGDPFGAAKSPAVLSFEEAQPRYVVLAQRTDAVKGLKELADELREVPQQADIKYQEEREETPAAAPAVSSSFKPNAAASPSRQRAIARFLLAAGLLGLIGVGFACMLRLSLKAWAWVPAVGASLACTAIGLCQLPEVCRHFDAGKAATKTFEAPGQTTAEAPAPAVVAPSEAVAKEAGESGKPGNMHRAKVEQPALVEETTLAARAGDELQRKDVSPAQQPAEEQGLTLEKKKVERDELADGKADGAAKFSNAPGVSSATTSVPVTLFWNPRLITDASGKATVRFQLPPQAGRYRVLVDAHANGRLGQAETLIVSESRPPVAAEASAALKPAEAPAAEASPARPAGEDQ